MALAPSVVINLPGPPSVLIDSVTTIAALRALASAGIENGQDIVVDGATALGDGGGGVYVWDELSTATDDGLLIVKPTDVPPLSAGRWKLTGASGGFIQSGTGGTAETIQDALRRVALFPEERGAVAGASNNNQTAIENAFADTRGARLAPGIMRGNTGNFDPVNGVQGSGAENSFLRTGHATNAVINSARSFLTLDDFTVDRTGAVAGTGVKWGGPSNAAPGERFSATRINSNGHTRGFDLQDFVYAFIEESYGQSGGTGLHVDRTGANFNTMLNVRKTWLRGNTAYGANLAGLKNSYGEQVTFEGSGVHTPVGLKIAGGDVHNWKNSWWEDVRLAGEFVGCGSVTLDGGYLNGAELTAHAYYAVGSGGLLSKLTFDGPWETQNLSGTFAIADADAVIRVRSPDLVGLTFSAINGGKVIFDYTFEGQATWNPASIAALTLGTGTTVTVTGARLGDICTASFENGTSDPQAFLFKADCFADNTVTVRPFNMTGGAIDLANGTLSVSVRKRPLLS